MSCLYHALKHCGSSTADVEESAYPEGILIRLDRIDENLANVEKTRDQVKPDNKQFPKISNFDLCI